MFPTDSHLYTEDYDYLSDSDLEDESSRSEGDEEPPETERNSQQSLEDSPDQRASETVLPDPPPPYPLSVEAREGRTDDRSTSFTIGYFHIRLTPVAGLMVVTQGWVKLPSSMIWEL